MIDALIGGRIHGKPAERTASNGHRYAIAKLRVVTHAGDAFFVNCIAWRDRAIEGLLAADDGDSLALTGELSPKIWADTNGQPRIVLDLTVHGVLSPYQVRRKRRAVAGEPDEAEEFAE
jgi:single-stranded DNA-binding protein